MPGIFRLSRAATALSTTADLLTIVAGAANPLELLLVQLTGAANAAAFNEALLTKSTGGTTPGGAITPNGDGTPAFSAYTSWSAQPTPGTAGTATERWRFGLQAFGGVSQFQALPGTLIKVPAGEQVSLRSISGTSSATLQVVLIEY